MERGAVNMDPVLRVEDLKIYFPMKKGFLGAGSAHIKAVDGVSFYLNEGETLGLVGESGCGKSTTARGILRLVPVTDGKVFFQGRDLTELEEGKFRPFRRDIQMVFQDPYASLNPRRTVGSIISEPLAIHRIGTLSERRNRVIELLQTVGLSPDHYSRFPHQFSGGQRQRIGVARALALNPKIIICDEPVSALDVSIQAQIINLLDGLQKDLGMAYLFISHDLGVVRHVSKRIAVMYLGKIVELSEREELFASPLHPYTRGLLKSIPVPDPDRRIKMIPITGDVPSPASPPPGCPFHTRCPEVLPICRKEVPLFREISPGHFCSCHLR